MKRNIVILVMTMVTLVNCKDKKSQEMINVEGDLLSGTVNDIEPKFKTQLTNFYLSYLKIVNLLANDKATKVIEKAKEAISIFNKIDEGKLTESEESKWIDFKINIVKALNDMTLAQKIEAKKASLKLLSENLASAIDAFGVKRKVYKMYCPMAKATWLSDHSEVRNPYFGSKMLHCGKVIREIKK